MSETEKIIDQLIPDVENAANDIVTRLKKSPDDVKFVKARISLLIVKVVVDAITNEIRKDLEL